jgi:transcriptional regulator with XRE-family HTH domain
MAKPIGVRLRALRREADWSTSELAAMLGLAEGSLRNIEGGSAGSMDDRKVHRAARLLTAQLNRPITFNYLVGETGDGVPEEPPQQPKQPKKDQGRKERGGTGPKRENRPAA